MTHALFICAVFSLLTAAVFIGFNKELDRQDVVRDYNCQHYGAAINRHYGQELCEIGE